MTYLQIEALSPTDNSSRENKRALTSKHSVRRLLATKVHEVVIDTSRRQASQTQFRILGWCRRFGVFSLIKNLLLTSSSLISSSV